MGDRIRDKTAIVTGAGSVGPGIGNGKAAAMLFAREGAGVMLVDYNLEAAEETRRLIQAEGGTCFTSQADVSSTSDCERIARECVSKYGGIDILHNNVGIEIPGGHSRNQRGRLGPQRSTSTSRASSSCAGRSSRT